MSDTLFHFGLKNGMCDHRDLESILVLELTFEGENIEDSNVRDEVLHLFIMDQVRTIKVKKKTYILVDLMFQFKI